MSVTILGSKAQFHMTSVNKVLAYDLVKDKFRNEDWMRRLTNMEEVLGEFGFYSETNTDGDIYRISYEADFYIELSSLFKVIAPFVQSGSYVELRPDNDKPFRYIFENGTCRKVTATITWEY